MSILRSWKTLTRTQSLATIQETLKGEEGSDSGSARLRKELGLWDLTSFGVAAIIGAGVFSTIGNAVSEGGAAVTLLFIFAGIACAFSALCYAEFASRAPIAGSAYTYAYLSFGEIFAWILGWNLLMEYAIGNIAVAISWSEYFARLMAGYGIHIPSYLSTDFVSASRAYDQVIALVKEGKSLGEVLSSGIPPQTVRSYSAWMEAPRLINLPLICNLPALLITFIVTTVSYIGIREAKLASNIFVLIKITVVLMVIILGAFYVHPTHWIPFAPHGAEGVFKGVSAVFFAYIGFDAISATAEECKNPQKDLPRGMFYSLLICTLLYVAVTLILTGIVPYWKLSVGDPLAYVFGPEGANIPWVSGVVSISAVIALFTVLLVYQIGQPRIWMAMSRDGLLPPIFSEIHPRYKTPWFSTLLTGLVVAIPSLFMNLTEVTNLASIGTLFAFALVCGGILILPQAEARKDVFRIPRINSRITFPTLMTCIALSLALFHPEGISSAFSTLPMTIFSLLMLLLSILCLRKNLSLIPILGLSCCSYLIAELGLANWIRFGVWLAVGLGIYFLYGFKNSKLRNSQKTISQPLQVLDPVSGSEL